MWVGTEGLGVFPVVHAGYDAHSAAIVERRPFLWRAPPPAFACPARCPCLDQQMALLLLLMSSLAIQENRPADPHRVISRAVAAVEGDSLSAVERRWMRTLTREPGNREALFGLFSLARLTNRFERADSLGKLLISGVNRPADAYGVSARLGIAASLVDGEYPVVADSEFTMARREARQIASPRLESEALMGLAQVRSRYSGIKVALHLVGESRSVYPRGTADEEASRLCAEGSLAEKAGDSTGERTIFRGLNMARSDGSRRARAMCQMLRGQMRLNRGYNDHALLDLDTTVFLLRQARAEPQLAIALQWLAYVRYQKRDFAGARRDYLESILLARRTRIRAVEAWAYTGLGEIAVVLHDLADGREFLSRALTLHQARNDRWGYATVRALEGELHDALGDADPARAALTEAVAVQTELGQRRMTIFPLRRLARLELDQGRLDDADRALAKTTENAGANSPGWRFERPYHLAGVAIARGDLTRADSLLQSMNWAKWQGEISGDLDYHFWIRSADLAARRGNFDDAEGAMARAAQALARWRLKLGAKEFRLAAAEARDSWGTIGQEYPSLIARLGRAGRIAPAFELSEANRARELAAITMRRSALDPDDSRLTTTISRLGKTGPVASLTQVQQALDDSTALFAYVTGRHRAPTTLFVVTRGRAVAHSLSPVDSLSSTLERYLRIVSSGTDPVALSRRLGDALLSAAVEALPAGISKLVIVPELLLYRIPFDALRLKDGRLAVERFTISIVPSATLAVSLGAGRRTTTARTLLAFGDPTFGELPRQAARVPGGSSPLLASANPEAVFGETRGPQDSARTTLARLQHSGDEVRRIARYSERSRILVRSGASEAALRRAKLDDVAILHLATHAMVDDRSLGRSTIALAHGGGDDGILGPEELGALRLNDALVVLSGCRTVGGVVLGGEGLRGLTAPLLEAGARAVVASHWAIGDRSVLPFIDRFYAHMATGVAVATALRRAKLDAVRDGARISDWAAFALVGDGSWRAPLVAPNIPFLPWRRDTTQPMRDTTSYLEPSAAR